MEPANLTPPPDDFDARLDALLREPAAALPDHGFSSRVLMALPPPRRATARWSRTVLCTVASVIGSLAAVVAVLLWGDWQATWGPLFDTFSSVKGSFTDLNVWLVIAVALGSTLYALQWLPRKLRS